MPRNWGAGDIHTHVYRGQGIGEEDKEIERDERKMEKCKGIMGVLMIVMLIMGMMMNGASATRNIDYGALGKDRGVGCSPKYPNSCHKHVANPYNRGCEKADRCRGD